MRYIDADKLQEEFKELHGGKRSLLIDTEPTADVVEVVRCKDCKYYAGEGMYCACDIMVHYDHFYCYWGERVTT